MPYQPSVQSKIALKTTSSTGANLGATLFCTTNQYFAERIRGYSSFDEVREDPAIPSSSPAYAGLRLAFSAPNACVPIYLGRRESSGLTLTPEVVADNTDYGLIFTVVDDTTLTPVVTEVSIDSGLAATAETINTALVAAMSSVANVTVVDNTTNFEVVADAGYEFTISDVTKLLDTYETSETASELFSALTDEDNENWYFFTCEDHTETFVLAMAAEIEATETSDFPKQYHLTTQESTTVVPLVEPAVDILGKLKELGYNRTMGNWNQDANTVYPEVFATANRGSYIPATTTWKFLQPSGIKEASDLVTGKPLPTSKQGYIKDRNASWYGTERNVNFFHGATMASGEWVDVIRGKDYINDQIEVVLLNLLLNNPQGKIPFTNAGKASVAAAVDSVLARCVQLGILSGYEPTNIPEITSFSDQAARILKEVKWTGYLAGAIHFIVVDGVLTYKESELV